MSFELKEKGNQLFKEGDYVSAEEMFSQACVYHIYSGA
jgi:STIP1 homology and U-box containing protein 1